MFGDCHGLRKSIPFGVEGGLPFLGEGVDARDIDCGSLRRAGSVRHDRVAKSGRTLFQTKSCQECMHASDEFETKGLR